MPNSRRSLRLLHTADLHLGAPFLWLGEAATIRRQDQLATFQRIITLAIEHQVDLLLIAGDLFDQPQPEPSLCLALESGFRRLLDHEIATVILPGTHDSTWGGVSVYGSREFPGVRILQQPLSSGPQLLETAAGSVWLYGTAYAGEDPAEFCAGMRRQEGDGFHVGLLHGSLKKSEQWDYRDKDIPFTADDLNSWGLDYVALGHYHRFETLTSEGAVIACYPGSPEGKQFGENGPRQVALVETDGYRTQVQPLEVQTRRLEQLALDMSMTGGIKELTQQLEKYAGEDCLLQLELQGIVGEPVNTSLLQATLLERFFYFEVIDRTAFADGALIRQLAREETIIGHCIRSFQQLLEQRPEDKELIEYAMKEVVLRFRSGAEAGS